MKKSSFIFSFIFLFVLDSIAQSPFIPGNTYYGTSNYTEYHPGNSPLIFSAPHGGSVAPSIIPDRTCNSPVLTTDSYTSELAKQIDTACMIIFGCHPHIIICNMSRKKVDCNRNLADGTCGNSEAAIAWNDFHGFLDTAYQTVMAQYGKGFYIDLHGQGHPIQRLELGYLIHATELRMADSTLNKSADTLRFSMHNLWNNNKATLKLTDLTKGPTAIGTQLAAKGYPSVSSQQDPFPQSGDPYFDGGYNTDRYSSANGGTIDGLQIEHNMTGVRDTYQNRKAYSDTLIKVLKNFLLTYYFTPANLSTCGTATSIQETTGNNDGIELFPNPAADQIQLKLSSKQEMIIIKMFDITAHLVLEKSVQNVNGSVKIPLENIMPGIYLVEVRSNAETTAHKLCIMPH